MVRELHVQNVNVDNMVVSRLLDHDTEIQSKASIDQTPLLGIHSYNISSVLDLRSNIFLVRYDRITLIYTVHY